MYCPTCKKTLEEGSTYCNWCGAPVDPARIEPEPVSHSALESQHDLKWYRFLIWGGLWLLAARNLIGGFTLVNALRESGRAALTVFCVTALNAGFLLFVRQRLAGWKKNGPRLYIVSICAGPVLTLVVRAVLYAVLNDRSFAIIDGAWLWSVVLSLAELFFNIRYFNNRAELFTE